MTDKDKEDIFGDILKVLKIVNKNEMESDKEYIFKCPICNGELHAFKTSYNGHLHIQCEGCKFILME